MRKKIKIIILAMALVLTGSTPRLKAEALNCPALRIVFARGSGGERWVDTNYLEYKSMIETKLLTTSVDYEFIDLDYPAAGVGFDNLSVTLGALIGSGDAYEFGASVNAGVENLVRLVNDECPGTKYVIGGYSQGAMVVSKALSKLDANKVVYAATFGDPKIYLPEGKGVVPAACKGENLSDYRMYVPDCQAYKGLLGAYVPYRPEVLAGKVGTWCNKRDIFCSSRFNISDHVAYISEHLYEDASRVIFNKITKQFGIENKISSPHDTAILIDSTGSMAELIDKYKSEALRLARETFASGGRVALYDYRDLDDPYSPVERCNFKTCTLEIFADEIEKIETDGGGDAPESLLSASFVTMKNLNWKLGSTKSLVILTDSNFLAPDRDGMTMQEVVKLSKTIDPVNFYIITEPGNEEYYQELADATDGRVVTNVDEFSLLTDYILERYDSLPRVEENEILAELPQINVVSHEWVSDTEVKIKFETDGLKTLVAVNDKVLGITNETEITISGLDKNKENFVALTALRDDVRGESVIIDLSGLGETRMPKAPNTGKRF